MDKRKNIDALFKDALSDMELPSGEGNWELLKHLMNEQKKRTRNIRTLRYLGSFLILALLVTALLIGLDKSAGSDPPSELSANGGARSKDAGRNEPAADHVEGPDRLVPISHMTTPPLRTGQPVDAGQAPRADREALTGPVRMAIAEDTALTRPVPAEAGIDGSPIADHGHSSQYATWSMRDSLFVEVTNLGSGINSAFSDYAPIISADGSTMFFTSRRPVTRKELNKGARSTEHIYRCMAGQDGEPWSMPAILTDAINVPGRNNSVIALSGDGQRMLLYRDDVTGHGDIYASSRTAVEWTKPVRMDGSINTEYHESSAGISPDGSVLFFVSDRPGGLGGRDIWSCSRDEAGNWRNAVNMGAPMNTDGDEEGVFVHPNGKALFFSSKGHNGLGGYDIYETTLGPEGWSMPRNLGAPINTPGDDLYFVMQADGRIGYYASSRTDGSGEEDIYRVTFRSQSRSSEHWRSDQVGPEGNTDQDMPARNGSHFSDRSHIQAATKLEEGNRSTSSKDVDPVPAFVLPAIYYDLDEAACDARAIAQLITVAVLLLDHPSLGLEVVGHTDGRGEEGYNQRLSEARARSVITYLVSKGINKDRLVAAGFGERMPVAANAHADGTDDPEGRRLNRRTEFKVFDRTKKQ